MRYRNTIQEKNAHTGDFNPYAENLLLNMPIYSGFDESVWCT